MPSTYNALEILTKKELIKMVRESERRFDELWNEMMDWRDRAEVAEYNFRVICDASDAHPRDIVRDVLAFRTVAE